MPIKGEELIRLLRYSAVRFASLQHSVGRAAAQKLTSLYGTAYQVGSICNIICK